MNITPTAFAVYWKDGGLCSLRVNQDDLKSLTDEQEARPLYDAPVPELIGALEMAEDELTVAGNNCEGSYTREHLHKQAAKLRALLARIKGEPA